MGALQPPRVDVEASASETRCEARLRSRLSPYTIQGRFVVDLEQAARAFGRGDSVVHGSPARLSHDALDPFASFRVHIYPKGMKAPSPSGGSACVIEVVSHVRRWPRTTWSDNRSRAVGRRWGRMRNVAATLSLAGHTFNKHYRSIGNCGSLIFSIPEATMKSVCGEGAAVRFDLTLHVSPVLRPGALSATQRCLLPSRGHEEQEPQPEPSSQPTGCYLNLFRNGPFYADDMTDLELEFEAPLCEEFADEAGESGEAELYRHGGVWRLFAHKSLVLSASGTLRELCELCGDGGGGPVRVRIPKFGVLDFVRFLTLLYDPRRRRTLPDVATDFAEARSVYLVADFLDCPSVLALALRQLGALAPPPHLHDSLLHFAERNGLEELWRRYVRELVRRVLAGEMSLACVELVLSKRTPAFVHAFAEHYARARAAALQRGQIPDSKRVL